MSAMKYCDCYKYTQEEIIDDDDLPPPLECRICLKLGISDILNGKIYSYSSGNKSVSYPTAK